MNNTLTTAEFTTASAIQRLYTMKAFRDEAEHAINQLSLAAVVKLISDLGAEDRSHAAKKLSIRRMKALGYAI